MLNQKPLCMSSVEEIEICSIAKLKMMPVAYKYLQSFEYNLDRRKKIVAMQVGLLQPLYLLDPNETYTNEFASPELLHPMRDMPNLGGNSKLSELLSALICIQLYKTVKVYPELIVPYLDPQSSKGDFMIETELGNYILVSTTRVYHRAYNYLETFLRDKMNGFWVAHMNINMKVRVNGIRRRLRPKMIFHIFVKNISKIPLILSTLRELRIQNRIEREKYGNDEFYPNYDSICTHVIHCSITEIYKNRTVRFPPNTNLELIMCDFNAEHLKAYNEFTRLLKGHIAGHYSDKGEIRFTLPRRGGVHPLNKALISAINKWVQSFGIIGRLISGEMMYDLGVWKTGLVERIGMASKNITNDILQSCDCVASVSEKTSSEIATSVMSSSDEIFETLMKLKKY